MGSYNDRQTIDILSLIQNQIQAEETKQLILIDLSKAFGSIDRNILWAFLYGKGLPWELIQNIRAGHLGNYLTPKYKEELRNKVYSGMGVFHGGPIGAMLFIIYFDRLLGNYEEN